MSDRFLFHSAVHLVLKKEGSILFQRRFNTGWQDGTYTFPAGHVDGGESVYAALIREMKEELGIILKQESLSVVHTTHRKSSGGREYFDVFIEASEWEGEVQNMEPDKCDDVRWFSESSLPENMPPYMPVALEHIKNKITFSTFGF